jgi:hypothetical protein
MTFRLYCLKMSIALNSSVQQPCFINRLTPVFVAELPPILIRRYGCSLQIRLLPSLDQLLRLSD